MQSLANEAIDNPEALNTLLDIARPRLTRIILARMPRQLSQRLDPEDIVQETLVTASRRFHEYHLNPTVPVFVWLRGMSLERLIEANRKHVFAEKRALNREVEQQRWLNQSSFDLLEHWAVDSQSPSRIFDREQREQDVRSILSELPEHYREVIVLRFFESLTVAETAAALGCSGANAKVIQ